MSEVAQLPLSGRLQTRARQALPRVGGLPREAHHRLLGVASITVLLALWEYAAQVGWISVRLMSSPSRVAASGQAMLLDGSFFEHLGVSATEFVWGYGLAALVGITLGILTGWYRRFQAALDPHMTFLYVVPQVAFLPLVLIWFGVGLSAKIALVFITALPGIMLSTRGGVRDVDPQLLRCARAFKASDAQIFRSVVLPYCVPHIMTGLKVASGRALVGVVVAELVGASAGLGFLIASAGSTFQVDKAYWAVFVIGCIGMGLSYLLGRLEKRFESWRPTPA